MATSDSTVGILSDNGSTEVFTGRGIWEQCVFSGDFGGGLIDTEISYDNGGSWIETGDRFGAEVAFKIDPFKNKYRFTLSGAVLPNIEYYISSVGV